MNMINIAKILSFYYLSFRNSYRCIENRPNDIFIAGRSCQGSVVSIESVVSYRKKTCQGDRERNSIVLSGRILNPLELFKMTESYIVFFP